jgi:hypothetical protein
MAFPFTLFMFISLSGTPNYDIHSTSNYDIRSTSNYDIHSTPNYDIHSTPNYDIRSTPNYEIDRITQPMFRITYIIVTSYNITNRLIAQSVWRVTTSRGSKPGRRRDFFFPKRQRRFRGPPSLLLSWYRVYFPGLKLTTHLHPVLRLRMSGAIPPLPL